MSEAVTQQAVKCWTEAGWSGDGGLRARRRAAGENQ